MLNDLQILTKYFMSFLVFFFLGVTILWILFLREKIIINVLIIKNSFISENVFIIKRSTTQNHFKCHFKRLYQIRMLFVDGRWGTDV